MSFPLEYHRWVKCSIPRSFSASLALSVMLALVAAAPGQNNANSSSGAGHSSSTGASSTGAPSFTSTNHPPSSSGPTSSGPTHHPTNPPNPTTNNPIHNQPRPQPPSSSGAGYYPYPYLSIVPMPYSADVADASAPDGSDDDSAYQGGPTVFDRRGSGADAYVPPVDEGPAQAQADEATAEEDAAATSEPAPDPTILIFKDGHQVEIQNYAVVSQTLYDLTPGHPHKIALADLNLPATEKLNDDRGVAFELPSSSVQAN
jgi:hypothetical protein